MRLILIIFMVIYSNCVLADDGVDNTSPFTGWHWYNEPIPRKDIEPKQKKNTTPDLSKMTPVEQSKVLQQYTKEALAKAILYPSSENTTVFLKWQKFWTDHASYFSQSFAVAELDHPELDYNLVRSHYNGTSPIQQAQQKTEEDKAIQKLASQYGLFLFYRGSNPIDAQMAGVVAAFARSKNIPLIPVSVDGQVVPAVPETRPDDGQSEAMNIKYFPALMLVDPKAKTYRPLAYGFMTQDDLATRFMYVATGFKPNF